MVKKIKISANSLYKTQDKLEKEITLLETKLKDVIEFQFAITFSESDGFLILHMDDAHNALLCDCLCTINNKGLLSEKDYLSLTL